MKKLGLPHQFFVSSIVTKKMFILPKSSETLNTSIVIVICIVVNYLGRLQKKEKITKSNEHNKWHLHIL